MPKVIYPFLEERNSKLEKAGLLAPWLAISSKDDRQMLTAYYANGLARGMRTYTLLDKETDTKIHFMRFESEKDQDSNLLTGFAGDLESLPGDLRVHSSEQELYDLSAFLGKGFFVDFKDSSFLSWKQLEGQVLKHQLLYRGISWEHDEPEEVFALGNNLLSAFCGGVYGVWHPLDEPRVGKDVDQQEGSEDDDQGYDQDGDLYSIREQEFYDYIIDSIKQGWSITVENDVYTLSNKEQRISWQKHIDDDGLIFPHTIRLEDVSSSGTKDISLRDDITTPLSKLLGRDSSVPVSTESRDVEILLDHFLGQKIHANLRCCLRKNYEVISFVLNQEAGVITEFSFEHSSSVDNVYVKKRENGCYETGVKVRALDALRDGNYWYMLVKIKERYESLLEARGYRKLLDNLSVSFPREFRYAKVAVWPKEPSGISQGDYQEASATRKLRSATKKRKGLDMDA